MKRALIALLAGVAVFGAVFAFAAALGVTSDNLGAGEDAVASCNGEVTNDVTVAYNVEYDGDADTPGYVVKSVDVSGIDEACNGQAVSVTLTDGDDGAIGDGSEDADASGSVSIVVADEPLAELVEGVHVLITG